jgi:hypothetical protein
LKAPTLIDLQDFTLGQYTDLLKYLKEIYTITPFCNVSFKKTPYLILRHDIDLSLSDALTMAKIEKDLGVKATYFVLLSTPAYNLFEGQNIVILKKISEYGHEIGLHYHPAQYRLYNQDAKKTLKIEIKILEGYLGKKIRSIARHGLYDRDPFATTREYINANHPFMRSDLFIHDSDRAWVTMDGLFTLLNNPPKRVQLLIHPDNWQKDKIDRKTLIDRHFERFENKIKDAKRAYYETIQQDKFVVEYDSNIKYYNKHEITYKTIPSNLSRRTLLNYYLVNSKFGWNLAIYKSRIIRRLSRHNASARFFF